MRDKVLTFTTRSTQGYPMPNTRVHVTVADKRVATVAPAEVVTNDAGEATTTLTRRGAGQTTLRVWLAGDGPGTRGRRLMTRVAVTG